MTRREMQAAAVTAAMEEALRRLPDRDLCDAHLRQVVYWAARFSNADIGEFDARALGNERMRREAFSELSEAEAA